MKQISYGAIALVLESWELARQRHGFEEKVATEIIMRLFDLEPKAKEVFGFQIDQDIPGDGMLMMGTLIHGKRIVAMLDTVLSSLGPDIETLEKILAQLGERHLRYGVQPQYFVFMGTAISETLSSILGEVWTQEIDQAWREVYGELSGEIVKAMLKSPRF